MAVCGAVPSLFVTLPPDDDDPTRGLAGAADPETDDCVVLLRLPSAADPPSFDCAITESGDSEATSRTPTRVQSPTPTPSAASDDDSIEEVEITDTPRTNLQGRIVIPRPHRHVLLASANAEVKRVDLRPEKENEKPVEVGSGTIFDSVVREQIHASPSKEDLIAEDMRSSLRSSNSFHYHARGDVPPKGRYEPKRTLAPPKSKLTHYSSADEILQRFSQKWRRPEDQKQSEDFQEELDVSYSQMPSRKSAPAQRASKPSEVEFLRQENEMLKQQLSYAESLLSDKVNSLTLSLEEGKKTWENAKKENIELRAKAELDVLKMQRMEDRIRTLEAALVHSNIEDPRGNSYDSQMKDTDPLHMRTAPSSHASPYSPSDPSFNRLSGGASLDLQLAREAAQMPASPDPPASSGSYSRSGSFGYGRSSAASHTSTGDQRLPKQYRSTGDLHSSLAWSPSRSTVNHDADYGAYGPRPSSLKQSPARHTASMQKVYWVDDPGRADEAPRRSNDDSRMHFEPPKVHPMIVKMATKRKRNERSRTLGPSDLPRARSPDRPTRPSSSASDAPRKNASKPAWLQRILSLKKAAGDENGRPPPGRAPGRRSDYGGGRPNEHHEGSSENGDYGAMERRRQLSGGSEGRPPPAVLIENIRARMRDFNATPTPQPPTPPLMNHHDAADGRNSVELSQQRFVAADHSLPPRPASSMELGRHQEPHPVDRFFEEDQALKLRVNSVLEREASRKGMTEAEAEAVLRPPMHGPVRAIHAFSNSDSGADLPPRPATAEPKVPPLDLSKLNPERIAQGNGLPTEMRNYADELIKKYMTTLSPNPE